MLMAPDLAGMSEGVQNDNCSNHALFLLSSLAVGGSERKTVRIANALAKSGKKLTIAYLNGPETCLGEIAENVSVVCPFQTHDSENSRAFTLSNT